MGYLLKEALKTMCGVNQWSYAVFWKFGCQNPKLLIWEECYYEPLTYSGLRNITGIKAPELAFEDWEACWDSVEAHTSQLGVQAEDKVQSLVNKMMMDNHVNIVGEGLVGRIAFTGNYQWVHLENYTREAHPPEVLNELCQQFSAGMQTVAVIPVLPHGVVQLGSSMAIMENMGFVKDVKTLVLQLGCVPGVLLSDNYAAKEAAPKIGLPIYLGKSVCADSSGRSRATNSTLIADNCSQQSNSAQGSGFAGQTLNSLMKQIQDSLQYTGSTFQASNMAQSVVTSHNDHCETKVRPIMKPNLPSISQIENGVTKDKEISLNPDAWLNQRDSLNIPTSGLDQRPFIDPSAASNAHLRLMEQQILSVTGDHSNNSLIVSNGFMTSELKTNGGLISSYHQNSITLPLVEVSNLHNGVNRNLRSISNPCSLSDANGPANKDISCMRLSESKRKNVNSSKREVSTTKFGDHFPNHLVSRSMDHRQHRTDGRCTQIEFAGSKERTENDLFQALSFPSPQPEKHSSLSDHISVLSQDCQKHEYGTQTRLKDVKYEDVCIQPPLGDDLFDILGVDFRNKLLNGSCNNFLENGLDKNAQNLDKNSSTSIKFWDVDSDLYSVNEGNPDSGIFSVTDTDNLLDAVVSKIQSAGKQGLDDNVSCRTTLTNLSSCSVPNASPSYSCVGLFNEMEGELFGIPKSLSKAKELGSCSIKSGSCKANAGNSSQSHSIYESQISSWVEQSHNVKQNSSASVSTAYSKRPDEISKSNRKRLKPGENPRPRPKDRQMIQDRVKELREIVPNGAKCSIDALLERTIKHMVFLQSVTKHADKLKQLGEPKIISKEGGLLLKDSFEGGATWAYEVGSQSMVCPIIVEDLNPPRQMLVEMLCEERGLFLEIADIIRGLGLTILTGVMETRNDKTWARFAVEANRDVTRMEIFLSLVRLLEQIVKSGAAASANGIGNDNMIHQFHQAPPIPATGMPCSLQ